MKKLLILALASAFVAAANADATINWGVTTSTLTNASWKDKNAPGVDDSVFKIDADVGDEVVLLPSGTAPDPQVETVVEVIATFTAVSDSLESLTGTDAKTAFTVAKEGDANYYYYWNGTAWRKLSGSTPSTSSSVKVTITMDKSVVNTTKVSFKVGETTLADAVTSATEIVLDNVDDVGGLAFAGTGSLTSVAATVTPAYAAKTVNNVTTRYATIADAGEGDITLYKHNGSFGTMPTVEGKLYFPASVSDNTASLYSFTKSGDAYQIATAADLKALVDLTAYDNTALALNFKQTDDITLDAAWPGIGIQNGKDLVSYEVGTGDGKITQTEADKRDAAWNKGAFKGTYDGGNYTISNFQMIGKGDNAEGLDYCGFFNSVDGATIKNLKIQYAGSLFAADTTKDTKESGATFVGVAKNSTLQNLTSLAGTVSCSKGFGGIVGYLAAGSSVESCTNNVNLTSLANNKVGGIAMICQQQGCSIANCENNGTTTTTSGEHGGIVGYTDTITIDGCVNTAACKMFYHHGGTVTLSGTNKGNATVASYTGNATPGLNFATVDGNVATFVANDILAVGVGKPYKVMAAGATATATLATKGSEISFDTELVNTESAKPTFNITAGAGLVAKSTTSGNVTTYTADKGYEVVSTAETTLVAVPAACTADTLIDTSNRAEGDVLKVYGKDDKGNKCYYTWTLTGANGTWTPLQTWVINGEAAATSHSKPASEVGLSAGQAAWLTRTSAASKNAKIILAVVAEGNTIPAIVEKGYNLVAPPPKAGASTITIDEVVADDATGKDKVFIPAEGKAPYNLDFKDGNWGYDKYTIKNGQLEKVRITDVTIPAGTGFFYINNGDAAKSVTLGSED